MRYKHARLRAPMTIIAAVTMTALVSACGGSGGDGDTLLGTGGNGNTPASQKTWRKAYAPVSDLSPYRLNYVGGDAGTFVTGDTITVTGNIEYQNGYIDALITRYTKDGQRLGHDIYTGKGTLHYFCVGVCTDYEKSVNYGFNHVKDAARTPSGGLVIVGTSNYAEAVIPSNTNARFVVKYGPNGQKLWQRIWKRCSTRVPCSSQAFAVAVGDNGTIFVSGHGYNTLGTQRFQLQAISPSGDFIWHDKRGFSQLDHGYDLLARAEAGSQYLYVTEPKHNYVHKYQVAGGAHLWDKQFSQRIVHIAAAPDGRNLLLFSADGGQVYKINPNGNIIWRHASPYPSQFKAVAVDADNGVIYVATEFMPSDGDRTHTYVYALSDNGKTAQIAWDTIYRSDALVLLDKKSKINIDLSHASDFPVAINTDGDTVTVILNTSEIRMIGLPDRNMATLLTLDAQTGEILHNKSVLNITLYSAAFSAQHNGIVFASGQTNAPRGFPAQTKQITGLFGLRGCGPDHVVATYACILNW